MSDPKASSTKAKDDAGESIETRVRVIDDHLIQHVVVVKQFSRTFPTSNVWVLHDQGEAALIDAGFGDDSCIGARRDYLEHELSHLDFGTIALTHHHFDHSSGAEQAARRPPRRGRDPPHRRGPAAYPDGEQRGSTGRRADSGAAARSGARRRCAPRSTAPSRTARASASAASACAPSTPPATPPATTATGSRSAACSSRATTCSASAPRRSARPRAGTWSSTFRASSACASCKPRSFAPGHGQTVTATDDKIPGAARPSRLPGTSDPRPDRARLHDRRPHPGAGSTPKSRRACGAPPAARSRSHLARLVGQGLVEVSEREKHWDVALTR